MICIDLSGHVLYQVPQLGTFYVPPEYQAFVASLVPVAGDFARGGRRLTPAHHIVSSISV